MFIFENEGDGCDVVTFCNGFLVKAPIILFDESLGSNPYFMALYLAVCNETHTYFIISITIISWYIWLPGGILTNHKNLVVYWKRVRKCQMRYFNNVQTYIHYDPNAIPYLCDIYFPMVAGWHQKPLTKYIYIHFLKHTLRIYPFKNKLYKTRK